MIKKGILIVLSGPSGAGKGTICRQLLKNKPELYYSISATTRQPRRGEEDGVNYFFLSQNQFKEMITNNELLEWAEVYGNYYGTPRGKVMELLSQGKDVILEIDTQGAMKVKNSFPDGVFIYIVPPSLNELAERIYKRGTDSAESIKNRLNCACEELHYSYNYNYVVVNDDVPAAVSKVIAIIQAEKCRITRNHELIDSICHSKCI